MFAHFSIRFRRKYRAFTFLSVFNLPLFYTKQLPHLTTTCYDDFLITKLPKSSEPTFGFNHFFSLSKLYWLHMKGRWLLTNIGWALKFCSFKRAYRWGPLSNGHYKSVVQPLVLGKWNTIHAFGAFLQYRGWIFAKPKSVSKGSIEMTISTWNWEPGSGFAIAVKIALIQMRTFMQMQSLSLVHFKAQLDA